MRRSLVAAMLAAIVLFGCSAAAAPTPQIIYVTAPPASPVATPSQATAATAAPAAPTSPSVASGSWQISPINSDPLSGKPSATAILLATTGVSQYGKPNEFVVRCKDGQTDMFIGLNQFLTTDATVSVTTRVDSDQAQEMSWANSTDQQSTFLLPGDRDVTSFVRALFPHTTFAARLTPYNDNVRTAIFDITGMEAATSNVANACSWPTPKPNPTEKNGQPCPTPWGVGSPSMPRECLYQ